MGNDVWEEHAERVKTDESLYNHDLSHAYRAHYLARSSVGTVLDVGCGDGYVSQRIMESGHNTFALDISMTRCRRTLERGIPTIRGDANRLPFRDKAVDTVVVTEVLEHMENPGAGLAEAVRCAKRVVLFTLPIGDWHEPTHVFFVNYDYVRAQDATVQDGGMLLVKLERVVSVK